MRRAAKVDANQPEIVEALRMIPGVTVYNTKLPLDLAIGFRGRTYLCEVKTDEGQLTRAQKQFLRTWTGHAAVVRSLSDVLTVLGIRS